MRTTSLSYKNKKVVRREPEDMVTVCGTHEAIVSQELWDKCREMEASVSQGKKNKTGYVNPLSGLVYCADCGSKMHIGWNNTRHKRSDPRTYRRDNFKCGAYAKFGERACTSHYIQIKILNQIVLEDIRSKISLVAADEASVRQDYIRRASRLTEAESAASRRQSRRLKARLEELERLLLSVYEDKVAGRIPAEVCVSLLEKYQAEKNAAKAELAELERREADTRQRQADVDEFIRRLKSYMDVPELTREMCMELIEFVTVDECPGKYSKQPREIHIYYKLIDKQASQQQKLSWQNFNV